MPVHFTLEEFENRRKRATDALSRADLDGILLFAPESHYYLTGYDTFGFAMFQCMVLSADGSIALLTRLPDLRQAQQTSILHNDQIHVWTEVEGSNPATYLLSLLTEMNLHTARLGIETQTAGLTAFNGNLVTQTLGKSGTLVEASDVIRLLRRDKSPQEIDYHRKAAALSDDALDAALKTAGPGAYEGDILASMQSAVFQGGGGYAGNEFIVGSGEQALLCRYQSSPRQLDTIDQLTLEWSGAYYRYQAAMMRTILIGQANDKQRAMHAAATEALLACEQAIVPGHPMGNVYTAHEKVFKDHGLEHARLQACGYGMGAVFNPIWVDFPMFYQDNPLIMNAGNVYFLHMILMDDITGHAMCYGHSVLVNESGVERLSRSSLALVVLG